jgi:hypothetical protein
MQQSPQTQMDSTRHFRVVLIEKSAMPQGAEDEGWYRYVLESGYASITGWRRGSLQEITQHAKHCAEEQNARSATGVPRRAYRRKTSH